MEKSGEIGKYITQSPWFQGLPFEAIQELIESAKTVPHEENTYLYRLGDQGHNIYCVLSGAVRIKISSVLGQEFAITDFNVGGWLGEMAITEKPTKMFEAQVLTYSVLLEIPARKIRALAERYPVIYKNLFYEQSERTIGMSELLGGMLFYPLRARLAGRLLWIMRENGIEQDDGTLLDKKISQQELASLTMGSRQRVNKIFREWQEQDIVLMEGQKYFIKDKEALYREIAPVNEE
jgi:CRP-like cAMP-binding protein